MKNYNEDKGSWVYLLILIRQFGQIRNWVTESDDLGQIIAFKKQYFG